MIDISSLSIDELAYLCNLIPLNGIKSFFNKKPKLFQKIRPGFRVKRLSSQDASALLSKNKDNPAIADFILFYVNLWLDSILKNYHTNLEHSQTPTDALSDTLSNSVFDKNPELYFKLTSENHTEEERTIVCYILHHFHTPSSSADTSHSDDTDQQNAVSELQKKIEEQKNHYETLLSDAHQQFDSYKTETDSALSALPQYRADNQSLKQEISRLKQLQAHSDTTELPSPISHQHTSLCQVCIPDYSTGQIWLRRIADLKGTTLYEFYQNKDLPPYFENRDLLFKRNGPDTSGYIGVWEWDSFPNNADPQKDYVSSFYTSYPIIEAFLLSSCHSISDLIDQLNRGLIRQLQSRMLIGYLDENGLYQGVLCSDNDFESKANKFFLKDTVFTLNHYELHKEDLIEVEDRFICRYLNIGMPTSLVAVKNPLDMVKSIILKRSSWPTFKQYGYLKSDWQKCRDFLNKLPSESLFEEISQSCHCSPEEAHQYVDTFISQASTYLDHTDIETDILQRLIENNDKLLASCLHSIEADWKASHEQQLNDAQTELKRIQTNIEQEQRRYDALQSKYQDTDAQLARISQQIDEKNRLAESVEKLVSERIAAAQKNAADFIASFAFIPQSTEAPAVSSAIHNAEILSAGIPISGNIEECSTCQDFLILLSESLIDSGISEKYADFMAAFLYSAYVNHIPLLLAGPNAVCIANALSISLYGRTAGKLLCSNEFSSHDLSTLQECSEQLLIVQGRFSYSWISRLEEWMAEKGGYFIITQPFVEDLIIEPHSLYNYILPVFTELFVDKPPITLLDGGLISENLLRPRFSVQSTLHQKTLTKLGAGRLVQNNIRTLLSLVHTLPNSHSEYDVLFVLLPYAYATGKTEALSEMIDLGQIQASKDVKMMISTFLGNDE